MRFDNYKRWMIWGVKYGPSIQAFACSLKLFIISYRITECDPFEYTVHWINLILNLIFIWFVYCQGATLGYCWKHRSLCYNAAWGYAYYGAFLLFGTPGYVTRLLTVYYVLMTICMLVLYRYIK